jgi:hypothetical protein
LQKIMFNRAKRGEMRHPLVQSDTVKTLVEYYGIQFRRQIEWNLGEIALLSTARALEKRRFTKKKFENENSYQSFLSAKTCTDALLEEAEARTFVLATTLVPTKEETAKDIFIICVACACMRFSRFGCEL